MPLNLRKYVTEEEINNYNDALPSDEVIMKYVSEKMKYFRIKNTGKNIEIKVSNNGTVKANNVYIDLEFPKEILVMEEDDVEALREPKKVDLPVNPIKRAEREYLKRLMPASVLADEFKHNNYGLSSLLSHNNNLNLNIRCT